MPALKSAFGRRGKGNGYANNILPLFDHHGCSLIGAAMSIFLNTKTVTARSVDIRDTVTALWLKNQGASLRSYVLGFMRPNYPAPAIQLQVVHAYEPNDGMNGEVHYVVIEDYTHNTGDFYWPEGDVEYNCKFATVTH